MAADDEARNMETMEKLVRELQDNINFKESTRVGDIVLIAALKPRMLVYALVTAIERDRSKRDEWWQVQMHLLSVPPQNITWFLRTEQLTGQEIFTMGGESRFIKAIDIPAPAVPGPPSDSEGKKTTGPGKPKLHVIK